MFVLGPEPGFLFVRLPPCTVRAEYGPLSIGFWRWAPIVNFITAVDATLVREPCLHLIDRDIGSSFFGCWLPARRSAILAFGFAFATFASFAFSFGSVVLAFAFAFAFAFSFAFSSTLASAFSDLCRGSFSLGLSNFH